MLLVDVSLLYDCKYSHSKELCFRDGSLGSTAVCLSVSLLHHHKSTQGIDSAWQMSHIFAFITTFNPLFFFLFSFYYF